jgi:hypothetical protein
MKGYLKNSLATAEAFGRLVPHRRPGRGAPDGYIKIKDRSKDIIISGGENISSVEVEDVLHRHPAVMLASVVALPDAKWGEVPCAFVELKPGAQTSEAEIIEFCRSQLARFKVPKRVVFTELPKTSTGKIQKYLLRERASPPRPSSEARRRSGRGAGPAAAAAGALRLYRLVQARQVGGQGLSLAAHRRTACSSSGPRLTRRPLPPASSTRCCSCCAWLLRCVTSSSSQRPALSMRRRCSRSPFTVSSRKVVGGPLASSVSWCTPGGMQTRRPVRPCSVCGTAPVPTTHRPAENSG